MSLDPKLIRCYEEVADCFDTYVHNNGIKDEIFSKMEIMKIISDYGIKTHSMFQPTDMFYNHTTKPMKKEDAGFFLRQSHIFEYKGYNKYRILGRNFPYTGKISKGHSNNEIVVGEWKNGEIVAYDINKLLDINDDYQEKMNIVLNEIENEIVDCSLKGYDTESIAKVRINHSVFRDKLIEKYKCCCLCGVEDPAFLRASHIKSWAESNPIEKVDVNNGLLLCPNHDLLFDKHYITFDDAGSIIISESLKRNERFFMNVSDDMKIELCEENKKYMEYHRKQLL